MIYWYQFFLQSHISVSALLTSIFLNTTQTHTHTHTHSLSLSLSLSQIVHSALLPLTLQGFTSNTFPQLTGQTTKVFYCRWVKNLKPLEINNFLLREKRIQRNQKSLTSSPKLNHNRSVNTTPNRISKHQVLAQLWSCHVCSNMFKSERVERHYCSTQRVVQQSTNVRPQLVAFSSTKFVRQTTSWKSIAFSEFTY